MRADHGQGICEGEGPGIDMRERNLNPRWNGGRKWSNGYRMRVCVGHPFADHQGYVSEHRLLVEWSIGHPLSPYNEVHHVNGRRAANIRGNLVACEDHAYHALLHVRARALEITGNVNARKCRLCRTWDVPGKNGLVSLVRSGRKHGEHARHRACHARYMQKKRK